VLSVVAVVAAGSLLWVLTVLISNRTVSPRGPFASDEFRVGHVEELVDRVPFLLPDASPSQRRDIYVQHLGDDVEEGWLAFAAYAPGQTDRECFLRWDGVQHFTDPCTERQFPAAGEGLQRYPTRVDEDGRLHVDLRSSTP
jgi:hypothetical protein